MIFHIFLLMCCMYQYILPYAVYTFHKIDSDSMEQILTIYKPLIFWFQDVFSLIYLLFFMVLHFIFGKFKVKSIILSFVLVSAVLKFESTFSRNGMFSHDLQTDLNKNVYGQSSAVKDLLNIFQFQNCPSTLHKTVQNDFSSQWDTCKTFTGTHVILLTGGPGVGKSFIASMIAKHYSAHHSMTYIIPELTPLSREDTLFYVEHKIMSLQSGFGLVIIDAVTMKQVTETYAYLKNLAEFSKRVKRGIIVVLVLKSVDVLSYNNVIGVDSFKNKEEYRNYVQTKSNAFAANAILYPLINYLHYYIIVLEPLTLEDVLKCRQTCKTKKKFDFSKDQNFVVSGCKNVC